MPEQIVTVKARGGQSGLSVMTYTTALEGRTPQQVAEQAAHDWQEQFEERYSDNEGLRASGEGFDLKVEVDGRKFKVIMRPVVEWVVVAAPDMTRLGLGINDNYPEDFQD